MKKKLAMLLTVILCMAWLLPAQAQAAEQKVLQTVEDRKTGTITQYFYDAQGRVVCKTDSEGNRETYSYHENRYSNAQQDLPELVCQYYQNKPVQFARYDNQGNVLMVQNWEKDGTVRCQRYFNSYNEEGRLIEVRYTGSVNNVVKEAVRTTYEYFEETETGGTGTYVERYEFHSEKDEIPHHVRFTTYDSQGRLLGDEYYDYATGEGETIENYYDDQGGLVKSIKLEPDGTIGRREYTNKYDRKGNLVEQDGVYTWEDTRGVPILVETFGFKYRYDNAGRMTREEYYEQGELYEYNTWQYDQNGNLLKHLVSGQVEEEYKYTYAPLSKSLWKDNT